MGGASWERVELAMDQAIHFCMRKADLNQDGVLGFEEFRSFTYSIPQPNLAQHTANLIFALFDLDSSGKITENEFKELFRFFLGHNPIEEEFRDEWGRLDIGGKSFASREDFIRRLQRNENPVFNRHAPPEGQPSGLRMSSSSPNFYEGNTSPGKSSSSSMPTRRPMMGATAPPRAKWNERFNTQLNANKELPGSRRTYFMRPQSLPELRRHFDTHTGLDANRKKLLAPAEKQKMKVLSTDSGRSFAFNEHLAKPGGTMKHHQTGQPKQWEDMWQTPKCVKKKIKPGSLDFRCPGLPPKWMFADGHEDL